MRIIIKEILDQKRELERILSKHKVNEPEEIEKGIEAGKLPEHPSYEDYLSALALLRLVHPPQALYSCTH